MICLHCNRSWSTPEYENICPDCQSVICESCAGSGTMVLPVDSEELLSPEYMVVDCEDCNGTGYQN